MKAAVLSHDEQISLAVKAKAGDAAARDRLVEFSLGLVRQIAYQFAPAADGFEVDDLIQEGSIALLDAIKWFDAAAGCKFTTYAGTAIKRRLARHMGIRTANPLHQESDEHEDSALTMAEEMSPIIAARRDEIRRSIAILPIASQQIVGQRIGLDGAVHNWSDIAKQFGISQTECREMFDHSISLLRQRALEPSAN